MLELEPTSIHASSQEGMRPQHPRLNRSRRDTPSLGAQWKLMSVLGGFRFCPEQSSTAAS